VGVMDRLGLSYDVLKKVNPRLVYGALRGFGDPRTGVSPYADWPAFDVVAQAMGGIMGITGTGPGAPTKVGPGVGDIVPGMMLAFGVLAAVHHARRTGEGQFLDISMVDGILAICERMIYQYSVSHTVAVPQGNGHPFLCPFGIFPAKDGFVAIAAPKQAFFSALCDLIDVPELAADPRFVSPVLRGVNQNALVEILGARTSNFTKSELTERLGGKIPYGPVMQMDEIAGDQHFSIREMLVPVEQPGCDHNIYVAGVPIKMTATPGGVHRRGPYLGEHTINVLRDAGLGELQIKQLAESRGAEK
ncbi:MAG: CoA transferase, partial [Nitrospira sp.]|nr:CoA transferase [Nitrospira sp.]